MNTQRKKPKICIIDVDGTLVDSERRFKLAQRGNSINWEIALDPKIIEKFDRPMPKYIIENIINLCNESDCKIVILTGRPERLREITIRQLETIGLREEEYILIMRREGDFRKELDYKISKLLELSKLYEIIAIFDDNIEFLKQVKTLLRNVKVYHVSKSEGIREVTEIEEQDTILRYLT